MKHTSLNIIYYGSCTRHLKKCSRCSRRGLSEGCLLGRYVWRRYKVARFVEGSRHPSAPQWDFSISYPWRFSNV